MGEKKKKEPDKLSHYVAIGASAGGLEAIESFFTSMPSGSSCAFIVIQHLSPDYKSLMVEILSKKTEMEVHRAEDGMEVKASNIYLIPPKKNLTIFHGKLLLVDQDPVRGTINLPIDIFLRSLAEDQGEKAVAIILSGTGSDGTRGVRVIKQFGGMIMVQSEESARFNGMPRAAISTGLADFILPPEEMPEQLIAFVKSPYSAKESRPQAMLGNEDGLTRIFSMLREQFKVDFTYYKPSTVVRRIERRMTVNQMEDIGDYVNYLQHYPSEAGTLFRELLIGVTSFFRDQAVFDLMKNTVLPEIIEASEGKELRLWVAGCSTGEEAYSLAILLRECMEQMGETRDVKIFATDIDKGAIQFAALGSYPESIAADVPLKYLGKYFIKRDEHFVITRNIREMVVFAQHNLIKDPPFTHVDFISCRNLLIYFQPVLQSKVFDFFNFSLSDGKYLLLGTSESIGDMGDCFETVDPKLKLFRSKGRIRTPGLPPPVGHVITDTRLHEQRSQFTHTRQALRTRDEQVLERFIDAVNKDFLPTAAIVNEHMEVLHVVGSSNKFFQLPEGKPTLQIDRLVRKELSIPLSTVIQKVIRQKKELRFSGIYLKTEDTTSQINLRIIPLAGKPGQSPLVAVLIMELKSSSEEKSDPQVHNYDLSKETEQRIHDLEQELQFSRENLQATIEELETSNEELQATNEELLASNEELQSTNEELQSTNEELYTVNTEYHSKIIELTELNNDVDNLLGSSFMGTLLLDENLEVRRFSSSMTALFKLLESDIGRPVTHIVHYLKNFDPLPHFKAVAQNKKSEEWEVETSEGVWYLMRIVPYAVGPRRYSGIVVSVTEISQIKETEEKLKESEQLFASAINSSPALVWISDTTKLCTWFNEPWLAFTGRTMEQEMGNGWTEGVHPDDFDRCLKVYTTAFDKKEKFTMEYRLRRHDGEYRWILDIGTPFYNTKGGFLGYIGSCLDIHDNRRNDG
jgi:two-component system, chemotaxis family, CheB/CheR fusion protein